MPVQDHLRPLVIHIVGSLPISEAIAALGMTLQDGKLPPYAKKACAYLMSRQLLRHEGVRGLYAAIFADEELSGDEASLEKLERVAQLLTVPPQALNPKVGYSIRD